MNRDDFTCRDCLSKENTLHVHHCFYEKGNPWDTGSEFLITLCEDCHKDRHEAEDLAKREIALLFTRLDASSIHSLACDAHWMLASKSLFEGAALLTSIHREFEAKVRWKELLDGLGIPEEKYTETLKKTGQFL